MSAGSFRRRRLGRELRHLREARGLTIEQVAPKADISEATLSRMERAVVAIKVNAVKAVLDVYGTEGEERDALLALARDANKLGWWHTYNDAIPEWFEVFVDLENEAEEINAYDIQVINGLFQTEEYARTLIKAAKPAEAEDEIERRVALRMKRQERVLRGDVRVWSIIDESALHRTYSNAAMMPAQITKLQEMGRFRNVDLQILPADSPLSTCGAFIIVRFTIEDPTVVYLEIETGALYLEKPGQVAPYSRLYERLRAAALSPEASLAHLAQLKE